MAKKQHIVREIMEFSDKQIRNALFVVLKFEVCYRPRITKNVLGMQSRPLLIKTLKELKKLKRER